MIPAETKALLSIPKRHPLFFAALYVPAMVSVAVACAIDRPRPSFLFSLVWCYLAGSFLIQGITDGQLTDNWGTALRRTMPVRFWGKVTLWSLGYLFGMVFALGLAVQERNRITAEPPVVPYVEPAARANGTGILPVVAPARRA